MYYKEKRKRESALNTLFKRENFTNEKFDIILLIGQSNAEGHGIGEVEKDYEPSESRMQLIDSYPVMYRPNDEGGESLDVPSETIYRITPAQENTRKSFGKQGCFAIYFAKEYYDAFLAESDRKTLIIRAAIGGTGFLRNQWTPDGVLYKRATEMLDIALGLNPENTLKAILWHQGENEIIDGRERGCEFLSSYYEGCLTGLISDLREGYGEVPFIAADFCEDWIPRYPRESEAIKTGALAAIGKFSLTGFVETKGLGSNDRIFIGKYPDDAHFNRPALYELGKRYFGIYKEILKK